MFFFFFLTGRAEREFTGFHFHLCFACMLIWQFVETFSLNLFELFRVKLSILYLVFWIFYIKIEAQVTFILVKRDEFVQINET